MKFKASIAQIDCRVGAIDYNINKHLEYIERAIENDYRLIVFPELSLTGYTLRDLAWDTAIDPYKNKIFDKLLTHSKKISIVLGFVESAEDHGVYNSAAFFEDGEIKHIHRKIYPPTYGMFEEGRYFNAGKKVSAFNSKLGRLGILVCEDLWHMSLPYLLALDGAEAILCLSASPTRLSGEGPQLDNQIVNYEHHRTYARLLSTYILFSNRVGFEDGVNFWGGSAITTPLGEINKAELLEECMITSEIDSLEVQRARRFSRHFLDENAHLVYSTLKRQIEQA